MNVYIAADRPLPLVPWDEAALSFHVEELGERDWERVVDRHFTKPMIYYAGSHQGCGCGFAFGRWPAKDDPPEMVASRRSMQRLADYLADAVAAGPIELYACWQGEEEMAEEGRDVLTPGAMAADVFRIEERRLLTIVPGAPGAGRA